MGEILVKERHESKYTGELNSSSSGQGHSKGETGCLWIVHGEVTVQWNSQVDKCSGTMDVLKSSLSTHGCRVPFSRELKASHSM